MSYYPAWFDYAMYLFGVAGVVAALAMKLQPASPKRGYLKVAVCCLFAMAMSFGGLGGVLFNLRAPHIKAQGELLGVLVNGGRGASTHFALTSATGEIDGLHLNGAHRSLVNGEVAEVVYQEGSHDVLYVEVLGGPNTGYSQSESDGSFDSLFVLVAALALAGYGILDWFYDGTAIPSESGPDNRPAPDGVDRASLLNLSGNDD